MQSSDCIPCAAKEGRAGLWKMWKHGGSGTKMLWRFDIFINYIHSSCYMETNATRNVVQLLVFIVYSEKYFLIVLCGCLCIMSSAITISQEVMLAFQISHMLCVILPLHDTLVLQSVHYIISWSIYGCDICTALVSQGSSKSTVEQMTIIYPWLYMCLICGVF